MSITIGVGLFTNLSLWLAVIVIGAITVVIISRGTR